MSRNSNIFLETTETCPKSKTFGFFDSNCPIHFVAVPRFRAIALVATKEKLHVDLKHSKTIFPCEKIDFFFPDLEDSLRLNSAEKK